MTATDTSPVSVASDFVICTSSDAYVTKCVFLVLAIRHFSNANLGKYYIFPRKLMMSDLHGYRLTLLGRFNCPMVLI